MDPDAVWKMLCEALQELQTRPDDLALRQHAIKLLDVLARWLRLGGFPPTMAKGDIT